MQNSKQMKWMFLILGVLCFIFILQWKGGWLDEDVVRSVPVQEAPKKTAAEIEKAGKVFVETLQYLKEQTVLSSYTVGLNTVLYATERWNSIDVPNKKEMLKLISDREADAIGVRNFQVRHWSSNELLAEVTVYGTVKLYK